jgi:hypothetical protein
MHDGQPSLHSQVSIRLRVFFQSGFIFAYRTVERVEAEIAESLNQIEGLVGIFQDKDVRYRPTKPNEQQLRVIMAFPQTILGLTKELFV